jgi:hypothetical protein
MITFFRLMRLIVTTFAFLSRFIHEQAVSDTMENRIAMRYRNRICIFFLFSIFFPGPGISARAVKTMYSSFEQYNNAACVVLSVSWPLDITDRYPQKSQIMLIGKPAFSQAAKEPAPLAMPILV